MTLVLIVAVPNADNTGLDLDRLEKVEDLPPEIARNMLQYGTAREPSEDELAEYHKAQGEQDQPAEGAERQFDNGGEVPPGVTSVRNKTGKAQPAVADEAAATAEQPTE